MVMVVIVWWCVGGDSVGGDSVMVIVWVASVMVCGCDGEWVVTSVMVCDSVVVCGW